MPAVQNTCASQYCAIGSDTERECGKITRLGQLEKCVVAAHSDCYLNFPDLTDQSKTAAYFRAIGSCYDQANNQLPAEYNPNVVQSIYY